MVTLSDGELDEIIYNNLKKHFNTNSIKDLSVDDRCRLAIILKKDYRIDTKRIARKLRIDLAALKELLDEAPIRQEF